MHGMKALISMLVAVLLPGMPSEMSAVPQLSADRQPTSQGSVMPGNPNQELPTTISPDIPNNATVVAGNLAVLSNGTVKSLNTGATVTSPKIVGTRTAPPDPLFKTNGSSFIPTSVSKVRAAMTNASDKQPSTTTEESAYYSASSYQAHNAALSNGEYGAYWGSYNDSPAFFGASGNLFAQQASGVIDVSQWQGNIDWARAKASGVQGAIIRIGFGWGNDFDTQALRNIRECKRLGIPFGIYLYSYAYDVGTAADEGADVVSKLWAAGVNPGDLSYPIFYDLEAWSWKGHSYPTSPTVYSNMADAWYSKLLAAGYTNLGVYSYTAYLRSELNSSSLHAKTRWVADYGPEMSFDFSTNDRGWQYSEQGKVNGIDGAVDVSAFGNRQYQASVNVGNYSTVSIPDGNYFINSFAKDSSGIDMPGASTAAGARPQLYQANGSQAQQYRFIRQANGSYVILNVNSGKALDVSGAVAGNGAVVQQWDRNGSLAQQWYVRDSGVGYYVQSALGNWVLDLAAGLVSNGTSARLYEPNGTATQKFLLSSSSANIPLNTAVNISSALQSGLVIDLPGGATSSGKRLQLYSWNRTNAQLYSFQSVGNGVYRVINLASGKAVEIAGGSTANGGAVQQWDSNDTHAQHWSLLSYGNSVYSLVNGASGKAIDVPGASAQAGTLLQSYTANGTSAQRWSISSQQAAVRLNGFAAQHRNDLQDGTVTLGTALSTSMVLDVAGASTANGAQVRLWNSNGTKAQRWRVSHDQLGHVTFTNVQSGKVLDVVAASTSNSAAIDQFEMNGTYAQKWIAVRGSNGSLTLYSALASGMVLDVSGGSSAAGTKVQLFTSNSTSAQLWNVR